MQQWIYSPLTSSEVTSKVAAADRSDTRLHKTMSINWIGLLNFLTCPIFSRAGCAQTLYLPFWSNTFGMVSFGKGSPLRRVPWMITTSPEYLFISRSRARDVYQVNQLYKTALERGHRVITHARQRTLSHHDSLQSRDAMASIPYLGIKPRHIKTTRPARH